MGLVSTERKFGAGGNASAHTATVNARKIEESDELKHAKVDKSLSKAIMQARMAKKMTQTFHAVTIQPGLIALTRTCGARLLAAVFVRPASASLDNV